MKRADAAAWEVRAPELFAQLAAHAPQLQSLMHHYPSDAAPNSTSALLAALVQLSQLTSLSLDVGNASVSTEQLDSVAPSLTALEHLPLRCRRGSHALQGGFPVRIATCCLKLRHLSICGAEPLGPVPSELGALTSLTRLALENGPAASLPDSISRLKDLQQLSVSVTLSVEQVEHPQAEPLPMGLTACRQLTWLCVGDGEVSPVLASLPSLHSLIIRASAAGHAHWTSLTGLTELALMCRDCFAPPGLGRMTSLRKLIITLPHVRPATLPEGPMIGRLQSLNMQECVFTEYAGDAAMPAFLSAAVELRQLDLSSENWGFSVLHASDRAVISHLPLLEDFILAKGFISYWNYFLNQLKEDCNRQGHPPPSIQPPSRTVPLADGSYFM